ncbi:hypothetical protein CBR_g30318 [Chara braunii]|uniref:Sugar phosphate transporter domain-containing protein n=1 Tax=Chara braunii TaxID=69332 RepID=A0A388JX17_CHABU|nr:hypothetical protein CBR_g30318 [Chara braunii]|eukprot:GBG62364.1 hypothetical protein CBR_g30318 [Chara braunii]
MAGIARMAAIGQPHVGVGGSECLASSRSRLRLRRGCSADRDLYSSIFSLSNSPAQAALDVSGPLSLSPALPTRCALATTPRLGQSVFLGRSFRESQSDDVKGKKKAGRTVPRKGGEGRISRVGVTPVASAAAAADAAADSGTGATEALPEADDANAAATPEKKIASTLMLGALFGLWYLFNIYFNIYNKQLLRILPLAVAHLLGNMLTNVSLGKVSVSFTHTIKALEPFFTVLLSALFLGEFPKPLVLASLVPIVGGVGLASISEEKALDNINLFSIITILACVLVLPIAFFTEGIRLTPAAISAAGLDVGQILTRTLIASICFHAYQQVSYMILAKVNPVTHSVGNCVKRVVVIVSSVIFFQTPVSPVNALGTAIALMGVFLYSRVKAAAKPKKA